MSNCSLKHVTVTETRCLEDKKIPVRKKEWNTQIKVERQNLSLQRDLIDFFSFLVFSP